jgi:cytidylate kinase
MMQRYYKANKESIILLSKKLAREMRRESLDAFMIAASKARLFVIKKREKERLEKERREKEEFERKKREVEEMKKDY